MSKILLFQADGKLPNFALMRLSAWHRSKGDEVILRRYASDLMFEQPDRVYSSSINELIALGCLPYPMVFDRSRLLLCRFQKWVIRRYHEVCTWEEFKAHHASQPGWY